MCKTKCAPSLGYNLLREIHKCLDGFSLPPPQGCLLDTFSSNAVTVSPNPALPPAFLVSGNGITVSLNAPNRSWEPLLPQISCQMQLTSNLQNLRKYLRSSPPLYPTATHGVQISPSPSDSAVASHIATPHPFSFLPIYHDYCLIDLLKCHSPVQTVTGFSPPKNNVCNS